MRLDARKHGGDGIVVDLCVIGTGAAGITLARKFAGSGVSVLLLESGGETIEDETEQLNANATVTGQPYPLAASRLRFIGGTTNHWSGHCYRFENRDFVDNVKAEVAGWPMSFTDIEPYLPEAASMALFRNTEPNWDPDHWRRTLKTKAWPLDKAVFKTRLTIVSPLSPDTNDRSYAAYLPETLKNQNINMLDHANVTELVEHGLSNEIQHAVVKTLAGNSFIVKAKCFVLACGGFENARLMLASQSRDDAGIGNGHDHVGRYFTDHVVVSQKMVRNTAMPMDALMAFQDLPGRQRIVGHFMLTESMLAQEGLDDVFLRITPDDEPLPASVGSARRLRDAVGALDFGGIESSDIAAVITSPGELAMQGVARGYCANDPTLFTIAARLVPRPQKDSRITLKKDRDAVGMPIANLHWDLADRGKYSIHRTLQLYANELGRVSAGRVRVDFNPADPWPEYPELDVGYHHTGSTRMSVAPENGVVNTDCRVHGLKNLYVAGSSVFPLAGSGSPTMMLTAMTLRLADHLKRSFFS